MKNRKIKIKIKNKKEKEENNQFQLNIRNFDRESLYMIDNKN